jgi:hypothetical protein
MPKSYMDRVLEAVDDTEWQKFRVSLKGLTTQEKLRRLKAYYNDVDFYSVHEGHTDHTLVEPSRPDVCKVCIRVDNYLKALARGGLLNPGVHVNLAAVSNFNLEVIR